MWHEEARQREAFHAGPGTLPPIHSGGGYVDDAEAGQGQQGPGTADSGGRERRVLAGKLDIRDLSWDDREKVRERLNFSFRDTRVLNTAPSRVRRSLRLWASAVLAAG